MKKSKIPESNIIMKVVLDCNVIIFAGLTDGICRKVLFDVLKNHKLFVSEDILLEYKEVILRDKFKNVKNYLLSLIKVICEISELKTTEKHGFTLPDINDLIYLDTALSANADYLITGNIKDFPDNPYKNVRIITPSQFLDL